MRWLLCLLTLCLSSSAFASGFVVARFGGEHGHPTSDNPTALYYNPAALSLGTGTRLFVDGIVAYRSVDYTRPEAAVMNPDNAGGASGLLNSGTAELRNFAVSPFLGFATDLNIPKLNVAFGVYAPFGGGASWSERDDLTDAQREAYPGVQDGTQRWWSIESSLKVLYATLAASYQVSDSLSVGVGLNYVMSSISTIRARNTDGSDDLTYTDPLTGEERLLEGRSYLDASGTSVAIGVGVMWEPSDELRVGYSYQSSPNLLSINGQMTGELLNVLRDGPAPTKAQEIEFHQTLPDIHRLGVTWRASDKVELRLFGDYVRWSLFDDQCISSKIGAPCFVDELGVTPMGSEATLNIKRNWRDAWGARVGGSYWLSPSAELYVGGGYDGNAAPDEGADPSLFDMNKYSAAAGARLSFLDNALRLALTYTQVFYETREVGLSYDDDGRPSNPFKAASNGPSAAGTYEQSVGVMNLNLEYQF